MSEDKEIVQKNNKNSIDYPVVTNLDVFKEYFNLAKKYWIFSIIIIFSTIVSTILGGVIVAIYYKKFFDILTLNSASIDISALYLIIYFILALKVAEWIGWRISWFSTNYLLANVMKDAVERSFDYLIEHSHSFFINNFAGSLVQRINRFARTFETLFERIIYDLMPLFITTIGAIIVLYLIQPIIAYALLTWMIVFILITYYLIKKKLKYDILAASMNSKLTGVLSDSVSNHSSIQFFSGYINESKKIDDINRPVRNLNLFRWNLMALITSVQSILTILIEFIVFYYGIKYWQIGLITLGTFILVQSYLINIGKNLWRFGSVIRDIYQGVADAKEMVEILHLPHEIQDIPNAKELIVESGSVEFKDIIFAFGQNKPVFNKLNIYIKAGEKVALIGHSGAGKSTLIKLLLRLHDIQSGEILIDGQNIKNVTQTSLRENMSLVPQDPALFHRTLMENIRYGKRTATDEQVIEASKSAHCDIFINEFTHKYETFVGERGIKLSGGERQRVAIARALLKNAPILILDEATSSLDSHSESLIQDALNVLMKGKTTLVIAHRLSTIKKMDRIIVLGKEGIIEEGSHDDLVKKDSAYAKLWNLQAGGFSEGNVDKLLD
jgi:ATP-binding cassette subfamily B protein